MTSTPVPEFQHRTVLLDEAVDALALHGARADGVYVDGTFGRGGHSRLILSKLGAKARLIAFDKDLQAIATTRRSPTAWPTTMSTRWRATPTATCGWA